MTHIYRLFLLHLAVTALFLRPALADEQRIAVLSLSGDLPEQTLTLLTDEIRAGVLQVTKSLGYTIMSRENITELLRDQGIDPEVCVAEANCEVEFGRNIGATMVISGSVVDLNGTLMLTMNLHDTLAANILATERVKAKSAEGLVEVTRSGAVALVHSGLSMVGGSSLSLQSGSVSVLEGIDRGENIVNVATEEAGFLIIESTPIAADVTINGKPYGQTVVQEELPAGNYVVVGTRGELYHPVREEVTLRADQTLQVLLPLRPAFGTLEVNSQPAGGRVFLQDKAVGRTPLRLEQKRSGSYRLRVELPDHHPFESTVLVEDEKVAKVDARLSSSVGGLAITSTPENAEIWINGEREGNTPYESLRLPPGNYKVRVAAPLYLPEETALVVQEGELTRHKAQLVANFGSLMVQSEPAGAAISLDGEPTRQATPYQFDRQKAGFVLVELTLPGHGTWRERVEVAATETTKVNPSLQARLGTLVVTAKQPNGDVCVGGQVLLDGEVIGTTPLRQQVVAIPHKLLVTCKGMQAHKRVDVNHNERTEVDLVLERFSAEDLRQARGQLGAARTLDVLAIGGTLVAGGTAGLRAFQADSYFQQAMAIDSSTQVDDYNEFWSNGQQSKQQAIVLGSVAGSALLGMAIHRRLVTKKRRAKVEYMEEVLEGPY